MSSPVPIAECARRSDLSSEAAFLAQHPEPALFVGSLPAFERVLDSGEFTTREAGYGAAAAEEGLESGGSLVWLLKEGNPSAGAMLTLGRTPNNDVYLGHEQVSKLHGYFQQRDGGWVYTDAGSTNGSEVDGVEAPALRPLPLEPGSKIVLGHRVHLVFLPPRLVYKLLEAQP